MPDFLVILSVNAYFAATLIFSIWVFVIVSNPLLTNKFSVYCCHYFLLIVIWPCRLWGQQYTLTLSELVRACPTLVSPRALFSLSILLCLPTLNQPTPRGIIHPLLLSVKHTQEAMLSIHLQQCYIVPAQDTWYLGLQIFLEDTEELVPPSLPAELDTREL